MDIDSNIFISYWATGGMVTFFFPPLPPNILPNVRLSASVPEPDAIIEHYKATTSEEKPEQESSPASTRGNVLKESIM